MVLLAPHPCVRWWNIEEMPLKLTRLDLHSLRGGSTHQKPSHPVGAGSVWLVGVWQPYGCVDVGGHSLPGQRMAPHTPEESPQVKTMCFRIGSCRLYAPMVPLAPPPCVRWWNTKEMSLKLTRLCLHSLKGGSSHQKPSYPVGQMTSPARLASLPKTTHPGGVDINEQGAVFHLLNGSGAKGDHGSLKLTPPKIEG